MSNDINRDVWQRACVQAWYDSDFRAKLLADPNAVLSELGGTLGDGVKIHVHEDTDTDIHVSIPHADTSIQSVSTPERGSSNGF